MGLMFEDNQYTHTKEASQRDSGKICELFFEQWCSDRELLAYYVDDYTHDFVLADGTQVDVKARNWFLEDENANWWIQVQQTKRQTAQLYAFYLYDRQTEHGLFCGVFSKKSLLECPVVKDGDPLPTPNKTPAKGDCYIVNRRQLGSRYEFYNYYYDKQRIILREDLDEQDKTISQRSALPGQDTGSL